MNKFSLLILLLSLILVSCQNKNNSLSQTSHLKISYKNHIYTVKISDNSSTFTFKFSSSNIPGTIHIPVTKIAALSTTHIGFLCKLNKQNYLVATSLKSLIYCPKLRKNLNHIANLGFENSINFNQLIQIKPTVLLVSYISPQLKNNLQNLKKLNITVIPVFEYLESSPLKRTKWIEFFGILTNSFSKSKKIFDSIKTRYIKLKRLTANYISKHNLKKPLILVNLPHNGIWFVPGGNSYFAQFIYDAGGSYPWKNIHKTTSLPLSIETVYSKAKNADILLNTGQINSIKQILSLDPRLKKFKPIALKQVYNYNKLTSPGQGFAFWELGPVQPDKILSDLINIFYPKNNFLCHKLYFYSKLK